MGELLDTVMRTTTVHEPGYLHYFTEATDGIPKIGTTLLTVLKAFDVDNKTPSTEPRATEEQIWAFFDRYDTEKPSALRSLYSNERERNLAAQAIFNLKISNQELNQFAEVCKSNAMVSTFRDVNFFCYQ
jgi:hypothetical protein